MPNRSSKDANQTAHHVMTQFVAISEGGKNPAAVALGRIGGLKGGKARAEKLTPKQRSRIARKAANARWSKQTQE